MALKDFRTGEMIDVLRDWQTEEKRKIFLAYTLTSTYPELIVKTHSSLSKAHKNRPKTLSKQEREKLSQLLSAMDDEFDESARIIDDICRTCERAFPEKTHDYAKVRETIFPLGLSFINTSYRNEAGETERIIERLEVSPDVRKTISEMKLNETPLSEWLDRLTDIGRRIGPLATRYDVKASAQEAVQLEFRERHQWMKIITTLRRLTDLAEWTDEHIEMIFGQVDRISSSREKSKSAEKPSEFKEDPTN